MYQLVHVVSHWIWLMSALLGRSSIAKNSAIVMAANKQLLAYYLLKSPSDNNGHYLGSLSLGAVIYG